MSPVNQEEPEALRDLVKYSFCYQDERNQPRTRWFPCIDPTDREYSPEQQRLARDLAAKLRDKKTAPTPKPRPPAPPPGPAERFVLIDGGVEDRDLIRDIAKRLKQRNLGVAIPLLIRDIAKRLKQRNLGVAIPLSALADQSGIKSSALTRDLRTKLSLCDSVLMVYRRGPVDQVSKHLVECLKACTKAPKGRTPPTIDLCQTQSDPLALGLYPKGMRIHVVDEACADNCVEWFLDGRSPS
jgi:hypothetical protein